MGVVEEKNTAETASLDDKQELIAMYASVIDCVNRTDVKLSWDIDSYPDDKFITEAISKQEMYVLRISGKIKAAAVINGNAAPEYYETDTVKSKELRLITENLV